MGASLVQSSETFLFNVLLDLTLQAYALADEGKISFSGTPASMRETLANLNHTLENIRKLTEPWQV